MEQRILVLDDDVELCDLLGEYLGKEGFDVAMAHDGLVGLERALQSDPDLVILDVMLPALSGFEVLRCLREQSRVPVLMLTARGEDVDRIVGLEMGADDYLAKPFNPRELIARIRAIQRRATGGPRVPATGVAPATVTVGDVELDPGSRSVRRGAAEVELTSVEFSILEALMRSAGHVVTRDELARQALGRAHSVYDRSVDVHVSSLRRKLGARAGETERIKTVRGVGYVLRDDE